MITNAQEIIDASRIEEVIGRFVKLDQHHKGLCPFHDEKTPSFSVSPVRGIYKCFGCGKGGNAVSFLMDNQKMSYPEALIWLASLNNIKVKAEKRTPEEEEILNKDMAVRQSISAVLHEAELFFIENRQYAIDYILARFGNNGTPDTWGIGYAPDSWTSLREHMIKKQFSTDILDISGLFVVKKEENKVFDYFRNRVMFPVYDDKNNLVGFGGRAMSEDEPAKYINSPENLLFHKSRVLFGFHAARQAVQKEGVLHLVEGYTDVIRLHSSGILNVSAAMGTALTDEQVLIIGRYARKVNMIYDGDDAGRKAARKNGQKLLREGIHVTISMLPDGQDPDSFFK